MTYLFIYLNIIIDTRSINGRRVEFESSTPTSFFASFKCRRRRIYKMESMFFFLLKKKQLAFVLFFIGEWVHFDISWRHFSVFVTDLICWRRWRRRRPWMNFSFGKRSFVLGLDLSSGAECARQSFDWDPHATSLMEMGVTVKPSSWQMAVFSKRENSSPWWRLAFNTPLATLLDNCFSHVRRIQIDDFRGWF